jgi:hypothetical protein
MDQQTDLDNMFRDISCVASGLFLQILHFVIRDLGGVEIKNIVLELCAIGALEQFRPTRIVEVLERNLGCRRGVCAHISAHKRRCGCWNRRCVSCTGGGHGASLQTPNVRTRLIAVHEYATCVDCGCRVWNLDGWPHDGLASWSRANLRSGLGWWLG